MFELNYKITESDFKSINKKLSMFYYMLYAVVATVGIIVGAFAIVLSEQIFMRVLGIILVVLGGILCICAVILIIAPKNLLMSAIPPSDDDLTVVVGEDGIAVKSQNVDKVVPFVEVTDVKEKKDALYVYVGKNVMLLVKNAITSGQDMAELYKFIYARRNGVVNPVLAKRNEQTSEDAQSEAADEETN